MPGSDIQNFKLVSVTPPAAILDNASATTSEVDTKGWSRARYIVYLGATDIALTALKLTESDTTGSGHTEIEATDFSDATQTDIDGNALALPSATDDNTFIVFDVNLEGRKRFLDLTLTVGDGTQGAFVAALCVLFKGGAGPGSVSEHGCSAMVSI